jgi:predicted kinase
MPDKTVKPVVVVFIGLTGSGKSYLAERWSIARGYPCFNSDQLRKELAGVAPESRHHVPFNVGLYSPGMTNHTYGEMLNRAAAALSQGATGVVLDGSYGAEEQRRQVIDEMADQCGVYFVHCHCSESVVKARFQLRAADSQAVSDGRWEIYQGQKKNFVVPEQVEGGSLLHLDTDARAEVLLARVDRFVEGG